MWIPGGAREGRNVGSFGPQSAGKFQHRRMLCQKFPVQASSFTGKKVCELSDELGTDISDPQPNAFASI